MNVGTWTGIARSHERWVIRDRIVSEGTFFAWRFAFFCCFAVFRHADCVCDDLLHFEMVATCFFSLEFTMRRGVSAWSKRHIVTEVKNKATSDNTLCLWVFFFFLLLFSPRQCRRSQQFTQKVWFKWRHVCSNRRHYFLRKPHKFMYPIGRSDLQPTKSMSRNILCIGDNYTIVIRLLVILRFISFSSSSRLSHQIDLILDPIFFSFFRFLFLNFAARMLFIRLSVCVQSVILIRIFQMHSRFQFSTGFATSKCIERWINNRKRVSKKSCLCATHIWLKVLTWLVCAFPMRSLAYVKDLHWHNAPVERKTKFPSVGKCSQNVYYFCKYLWRL